MRKSTGEFSLITVVVGLFVALFILAAAVACNGGGGGDSYYYPQDHSHGYYDTHHHYHYYPKYNPKSRSYVKPRSGGLGVKVKPAPRSGGGFSFRKSSGGSGFKSGGGFRRR